MKELFRKSLSIWCLYAALLGGAGAQSLDNYGFVRFVNLVEAGQGNLKASIAGNDLKKRGFELGERSFPIPLPSGNHELRVAREGCMPSVLTIEVSAGKTQAVFARSVPEFGDDGELLRWWIRLVPVEHASRGDERGVTFLSFSKIDPLPVRIERQNAPTIFVNLKRNDAQWIEVPFTGNPAGFFSGENQLTEAIPDREGQHVLIVFDQGEDGKLGSVFYRDVAFSFDSSRLTPGNLTEE
ncbi:MAG: hypothetical protein AAF555_04070 [Verrucomicrobiota bacterium]